MSLFSMGVMLFIFPSATVTFAVKICLFIISTTLPVIENSFVVILIS